MTRLARLALLGLAVLAIGPGAAHAVTEEYSTGTIKARIGSEFDQALAVPDAGPVSFVRVSLRISVADTSSLAISLVSPRGTKVPLVANRGSGADFGSDEKGCGGYLTVLESDERTNAVSSGKAPFIDNPYRADGNLRSLYDQNARGRWLLHIENNGDPATLHCLTLDISRAVPERLSAASGAIRAQATFTERNNIFEGLRIKVARAGRTGLDAPVERLGCRECATFRPISIAVHDLDGGEPEVLLDLNTGGAHCCDVLLVLRYDAQARRYRGKLLFFGNYGHRLVDLDRDGLPEVSAYDERFVYTFSAYVFSSAPLRITRYRDGRVVDVTRRFPALVEKDAARNWKLYLQGRRQRDVDVRTYLAVYVADQYLLGRPEEARRVLDLALRRGDLGPGKELLGTPAGAAFVRELMRDLRKWGYVRSS